MADQALPLRRYLSANLVALAPPAVALGALHWMGYLAGGPALIAFGGIAVVTAILVQRYLGSLARFARFVGELSGEEEPVMPRLPFAPATEELASAAATLSAGWRRQRASIDNLAASAQAVVDGLPDPLIAVDRQRRIVRTNRAADALLGPTGADRDLSTALRHPELPRQVEGVAVTLFGVIYVGWLSAHLVMLRELPWRAGTDYGLGASFVFLAFFVTWSCDTGAYAVGRVWGRIRPWTTISPRKSLEGAAGGFACAIAAAFIARAWFAPYLRGLDAAVLGALVGVFAQLGDFVESLLKRDARHDDSSDLIPGHGGILDRFDSLYFSAPVVFYYLRLVVFRAP